VAILLGWIATFTSANGMMIFVAGALVMLLNKNKPDRKMILWVLGGAVAMASYFFHYAKPEQHPDILKPLIANPLGFFGYIFSFLGGAFTEDPTVSVTIGALLSAITLFLLYKKYHKENPVHFAYLIFILITAALAALTRFGFGLGQSLSSKYTIISAVMTIFCYTSLLSVFHKKIKMIYILILTALSVYFYTDTYKKYIPAKKAEKETFEKEYLLASAGKLSNFNFGWPPLDERKEMPRKLLRASDSLGYFHFKFKDEGEILNSIPTDSTRTGNFKLERFEQTQVNALIMSGWAYIKKTSSAGLTTVLCLRNQQDGKVKYFVCQPYLRQDVTQANAADHADYDQSGFFTFYNPKEVPPGQYLLEVILTDSNSKVVINTGQILNMK
jgi:hypothetical protein